MVGYPCTRKNSNSNSLADTLMRIELEVHDSIRVVGFFMTSTYQTRTRTYETDRASFYPKFGAYRNRTAKMLAHLYWVSIIWWEALLNQQLF